VNSTPILFIQVEDLNSSFGPNGSFILFAHRHAFKESHAVLQALERIVDREHNPRHADLANVELKERIGELGRRGGDKVGLVIFTNRSIHRRVLTS
jgi:hypothetical protein